MTPATFPLSATRNAPYLEDVVDIEGFDFSAATFAMQIRIRKAATGDPLISLTGQAAGTEGISCVVTDVDGVDVSTITIQIDEATLDAILPAVSNGQKAGTDVVLYYDLIITGGGVGKRRWLEGTFTILEGVTV